MAAAFSELLLPNPIAHANTLTVHLTQKIQRQSYLSTYILILYLCINVFDHKLLFFLLLLLFIEDSFLFLEQLYMYFLDPPLPTRSFHSYDMKQKFTRTMI